MKILNKTYNDFWFLGNHFRIRYRILIDTFYKIEMTFCIEGYVEEKFKEVIENIDDKIIIDQIRHIKIFDSQSYPENISINLAGYKLRFIKKTIF